MVVVVGEREVFCLMVLRFSGSGLYSQVVSDSCIWPAIPAHVPLPARVQNTSPTACEPSLPHFRVDWLDPLHVGTCRLESGIQDPGAGGPG